MNKETQVKNLETLKKIHKEILDKGSEISKSSPNSNKNFGSDLSTVRRMLKDFFQAFGAIDKSDKVTHGHLLNEPTMISMLIEG